MTDDKTLLELLQVQGTGAPLAVAYGERGLIPGNMVESLIAYATQGIPTGDFLQAVIANDLIDAYARADMVSTQALPAIAAFVHHELPHNCWGSRRVYAAWLEVHAARRESERAKDQGPDAVGAAAAREYNAIGELRDAKWAAELWRRPVVR